LAAPERAGATDLHRDLALTACVACGGVAEVTATFELPGDARAEAYVRTRCLVGHLVVVPAFVVETD
jgi:hypothetical protein